MKIRDYLAGVDPLKCDGFRYFSAAGLPMCPLAHAAHRRGYERPVDHVWRQAAPVSAIASWFKIHQDILARFTDTYDHALRHYGVGPLEAYSKALAAAEILEGELGENP